MLYFGLSHERFSREGTSRNSALTWKEAASLSLLWFYSSRKECERSSINTFISKNNWNLAKTKENAAIISTKPFNKAQIVDIFHISVVSRSCALFHMGNTILYGQQKPLQFLHITVSNLKNDNDE